MPDAALHVVAGILFDERQRVLIAQRPFGKALAGRWEFPGGKVHVDHAEAPYDALVRELREELGIEVMHAERLMYYGVGNAMARTIWLDVWVVTEWHGTVHGLDDQALEWVERSALRVHDILEADAPIIASLERMPAA